MTPLRNALAFLVLLALIVLGQWSSNAYNAEFMEDSDESAHYVTGLMVRDYLATGFPRPPMEFAQRFHSHYPRVAFGHWPPFFYILESAWMLPFTESRTSILLFAASIAALWALLCLNLFLRFLRPLESWLAVLFLIATPEALKTSRMVMSETLMGLLIVAALWTLHKLFESPCRRWSILFGALACAALLTKGTGVLLAPLPILAVITLRRWDLLKSPWFWLPAVMVAGLCGPWYALAPYALHEKAAPFGGPRVRDFRIAGFFVTLASQLTWPGLALAVAGWWRTARRITRGEEKSPFWVLALWIIPAAWAFHVVIGAWHARHLITLTPFLLLFAAVGLRWAFAALGQRRPILEGIVAALVLAAAGQHLAVNGRKPHRGLDHVAQEMLTRPELAGKPWLVVSDPAGEGAFVAEVAMRGKRPGQTVLRGYKDLTDYTKIGQAAAPRFKSPRETLNHLRNQPDTVLIYDAAANRDGHGELIGGMLTAFPNHWREVYVYSRPDATRPHRPVLIRVMVPVAVLGQ